MLKSEAIHSDEWVDLGSERAEASVGTMAVELGLLTMVKKTTGRYAEEILRIPVLYNSRFKRKYGRFDGRKKIIELANWLNNDAEELRDTFLHEVAHAICSAVGVSERPHGPTWKKYAAALGATPKACGNVAVKGQARYQPRKLKAVGECEDCGFVFERRQAFRNDRVYRCAVEDGLGLECDGLVMPYPSHWTSCP